MNRRDLVTALTGASPVTWGALHLSSSRLKVVAFHDVADQESFARQLHWIVRSTQVVNAQAVVASLYGGPSLPRRAVWLTFDDGDRTVVENGLPVLVDLGLPATLFACPGLIAGSSPFWWAVADAAQRGGLPASSSTNLKRVRDAERRAVMADLVAFEAHAASRSIDEAALDRWLAAGMTVGNHTWDHPCLDQCTGDEQEQQIVLAHEWLCSKLGRHPGLFAYPNGDRTETAQYVLSRLEYRVACLFDHRLCRAEPDPLNLSRLSLTAGADDRRTRAVVSGAHPLALRLLGQRRGGSKHR